MQIKQTHLETKRRFRVHSRTHRRGSRTYTYDEIRFGGLWLEMAGWSPGDRYEREDGARTIKLTRVAPSKASANAGKVSPKIESRSGRKYPNVRLIEGVSRLAEGGEEIEVEVTGPGKLTIRRTTPRRKAA